MTKKIVCLILVFAVAMQIIPAFAAGENVNTLKIVAEMEGNETIMSMTFEKDNQTDFTNKTAYDNVKTIGGEYGTVYVKPSGGSSIYKKMDAPEETGLIFINFDFLIPFQSVGKYFYVRLFNSKLTGITDANTSNMIETFMANQETFQVGAFASSVGWTRKYLMPIEENKWVNVNMWLDLDVHIIYYCVDNQFMSQEIYDAGKLNDLAGIAFSAAGENYYDNITFTKVKRTNLEGIEKMGVTVPEGLKKTLFISSYIGGVGNVTGNLNTQIPADITIKNIAEADYNLEAELRTVSEDGRLVYEETQNITAKAMTETILKSTVPGVSNYGFYYMDVKLKEKDTGKVLGEDRFGFSAVRYPEAGKRNSEFGIINHVRHTRMGDPLINLEFLDKAGFSTTRSEHTWALYEKIPGQYQLTDEYIRHVSAKAEKGIGHLEILAFENYAVHPESPPVSDEALDLFTDYGVQMVSDLKAILGEAPLEVEVWNEYNGRADYFNKSNQPPESYAKMLKATYEKLKIHHPDTKIWGGATIGVANAWLERVIKAGGGDFVDGISIHPYTNKSCPELGGAIQQIIDLKKMLAENGYPDMPLRATEWGWPSTGINGYVDQIEQASYVVRMNVLNDYHGDLFEHIDWYTINDGGEDMQNAEHAFGLLYGPNNKIPYGAKPGFLSAANFNRIMTNASYVEAVQIGEDVKAYRYVLDDGQDCVVAWKVTDGNEICGLDLGTDKVQIIDMYGNESSLYANNGVFNVSYDISPVYLVGDFDKLLKAEPSFKLDSESIRIVAGDNASLKFADYSGVKNAVAVDNTADVAYRGSSGYVGNVTYLNFSSNGTMLDDSKVVLKVMDKDKLLFTTKISVEYVDENEVSVTVRPKNLQNADLYEAVFEVKNNTSSKITNAVAELTYPDKIQGNFFEILNVAPQSTGQFIYNIPSYLVDGNKVDFKASFNINGKEPFDVRVNENLLCCAYMDKPPMIDGKISEGEWNKNSAMDLSKGGKYVYLDGAPYAGQNDLSGEVYIAWDNENFYLGAEILDDVFSDDKLEGGVLWRSDGIQFAMAQYRGAASVSQFDIAKVGGVNKVQIDRHPVATGMLNEGYDLAIEREGNITTYELRLPWSIIFTDDYVVGKNGELAMSFMVNENDGTVRRGYLEYGSGIGTGTADTSVYNNFFMLGSRLIDELK